MAKSLPESTHLSSLAVALIKMALISRATGSICGKVALAIREIEFKIRIHLVRLSNVSSAVCLCFAMSLAHVSDEKPLQGSSHLKPDSV